MRRPATSVMWSGRPSWATLLTNVVGSPARNAVGELKIASELPASSSKRSNAASALPSVVDDGGIGRGAHPPARRAGDRRSRLPINAIPLPAEFARRDAVHVADTAGVGREGLAHLGPAGDGDGPGGGRAAELREPVAPGVVRNGVAARLRVVLQVLDDLGRRVPGEALLHQRREAAQMRSGKARSDGCRAKRRRVDARRADDVGP